MTHLDTLLGTTIQLGSAGAPPADPFVDDRLPGALGHLIADRNHALLRVDGVGTFAVRDGTQIRFEPAEGLAAGAESIWLHGTVAALLLAQRGCFALHASVVEVGGVGVALAGPRGAGKSTTALRLAQRGHRLVTDDVSPVEAGDPPSVRAFGRPVRITPQAAATLGLDLSEARREPPSHPKLSLPAAAGPSVPLLAIAVLAGPVSQGSVDVTRRHGAAAHWLIVENTYRIDLLRRLWEHEAFVWAASVAAGVPVHIVPRAGEGWTVDAVADAVEALVG
ncbi:MAG: hypothetical protein AVDCRST_MAG85-3304 [uncultured Solirubrobacteraceae bacterium]|uniref:HPr kinase/phosphorylase C-terminal domain-containing protein n=1 Tax=uncultured Solirubrobacteraceae bacterium TaxID=1162706 RepID=A0A6J4TLT1_9ACTN|nr:MAG: hypothetical protein AVDCRST_MAG85-3304 [uncultured Solirubrobacteraceae bacterium]